MTDLREVAAVRPCWGSPSILSEGKWHLGWWGEVETKIRGLRDGVIHHVVIHPHHSIRVMLKVGTHEGVTWAQVTG